MEQQEFGIAKCDRRLGYSGQDHRLTAADAAHAVRRACDLVVAFALLAASMCASPGSPGDQREELRAHAARAQAAIHANNAAVATEELQSVLRLDPKNVNALASLGMVAFTQADYTRAAKQFQAALALSPSLWNAQAFLGVCELRLGNIAAGQRRIEASFPHLEDKALKARSGLDLVESYTTLGEFAKALPILEALRRSDPGNTEVLYVSYRVYSELAASSLRNLQAAAPDSVRVHQVLAQNHMAQEQYPAAIEEYRKALERDPHLQGLHFELGQAILALAPTDENRESAMKEFRAELEINPRDPDSYFKLGEIALAKSDVNEAKKFYLRAIELRPEFGEAQIALGKILADAGDRPGGISYLEAGVRLKPTDKTAHYRLARLYRDSGRSSDAERELAIFKKLSEGEK